MPSRTASIRGATALHSQADRAVVRGDRQGRVAWRLLAALLLAVLAGSAQSHEYYPAGFRIVHPWADATLPQARSAAVYLRIEEIATDDRLIAAHTPFAGRVELRAGPGPSAVGQVVLPAIGIAPGEAIELSAAGAHLLLVDLTAPLQWGRSYPMTLEFEKAGPVQVMVSIGAH
jgi:copper(I)-binding protein